MVPSSPPRPLVASLTTALVVSFALAGAARAEEPPGTVVDDGTGTLANDADADAVPDEIPDFLERFLLETARHDFHPPSPDAITVSLRGEYQLRYRAMSDLALEARIGHPESNSLRQNNYLYHWLRVGARLSYRDKIAFVAQIDVPSGLIAGDTTRDVEAARDALAVAKWSEVHPRYLYVEYTAPIGVFRVGQQSSYWGMGLVANDGDHPSLFGDYQRGGLYERALFATQPFGKGSPISVAVAADLVFQDQTADLARDHDRAFQGVAAVLYKAEPLELGVYGVLRHQERDGIARDAFAPFVESLTAGVIDVTARLRGLVPGARAYVYGEAEAALVLGATNYLRGSYTTPIDPTTPRSLDALRSFGGAATLGVVHVAGGSNDAWGDVVVEFEAGYASGDADPNDGVEKRFTFESNHRVGLILFNQVLAWKTARAATIAQDPAIVDRAAPGLSLLPSNGAVFGAQYLNPRFVVRPKRWVDLKVGAVLAQTTADFVDPYHLAALGNAANYDGGDSRRHDLGGEIDYGFDMRFEVDSNTTLQAGAEGGVLFPGHAFDGPDGQSLTNQYLANVKLGLQF